MKLKILFVSALCFFILSQASAGNGPRYKISVTITGWQKKVVYFGFYLGENPYIGVNKDKKKDSAIADAKGSFTFSADSVLPQGVYFVLTKDNRQRIEFIIDREQQFSISSDSADVVGKATIKGSDENALFYGYQKFLAEKYKEVAKYREQHNRAMMDTANQQVMRYSNDLCSKHPDMLLTKILKAGTEPNVPPTPKLTNGRADSTFPYRYYKAHYFDNIDLTDERLIRTPLLFPKIKIYMEKLTAPVPDSIIASADYIIGKTGANKEMFRFIVGWITDKYETSEIMGMEKVFVHMVNKYYTPDKAFWVSASQLERIRERATQLEPILLGMPAPELVLPDSNNVMQPVDSIHANYTVLYFWDYDCGHCQQETPKLIKWYDSIKGEGVEVYAVEENEKELKKWKEYVRKNKLDWINVSDIFGTGNFRHQYDIITTPTIYVLDENHNIIAKKINVSDLNKVIKHDMDRERKPGRK
jgi:peroxiredoxin